MMASWQALRLMTHVLLCLTFIVKAHANVPCGIRQMSRIIGGEEARPHSWPWQAEILIKDEDSGNFTFRCGGTLITPEYIVTAAHCIFGMPLPEFYQIRLGVHDRNVARGVQKINVSEIHIDKKALTKGYGNDIALLKLYRAAIIGRGVGLACLPSGDPADRVMSGTMCYVTGWGSTYFQSEKSRVLKQAKIPIANYSTCAEGNKHVGQVVDKIMVCAGYGGTNKTSGCHGDSGGPLVCQDKKNHRWILRGTVSWGDYRCRGGPTYSVFVRINSFVQWIKNKMVSKPLEPAKDCQDAHNYCKSWHASNLCDHPYYKTMLQRFYCKHTCGNCITKAQDSDLLG